jgi:hypothetical protein
VAVVAIIAVVIVVWLLVRNNDSSELLLPLFLTPRAMWMTTRRDRDPNRVT